MSDRLPLHEIRARLAAADKSISALVVAYGADAYLRSICASLTDLHGLLRDAEREVGRPLAGTW